MTGIMHFGSRVELNFVAVILRGEYLLVMSYLLLNVYSVWQREITFQILPKVRECLKMTFWSH
jgi:hypothetical protein